MSTRRALLSFVLALAATCAAAQSMPVDQREALNAAERWLEPVDAELYARAWTMASEPFKQQVSREDFSSGIRGIRKDYGKVVVRKGERLAYVGTQPGPDYVEKGPKEGMKIAIIFDTKFAGSKQATEEVTMVFEKDGLWRVAGYFIR